MLSLVVCVFPATVQHLLLTHIKDSAISAVTGTPLISTTECSVFPDVPGMDSSSEIQTSINLTTISLVFLGGSWLL
jgi:hypothetical protein